MTTLYRVLTGQDNSEFSYKVTLALSKGWKLYEDPQYSYDSQSSKMRYAQAVVKNIR